ncbi:PAS domain-containing protein [Frankia sp. AgB32]|uniref:PAS domain-containing protein n=1 Tax=Frankia sp. AgB32 TaxID=631119 RepID=UPI0027E32697|nr:PAS domain-containing protein [Frankia sp. AgB32]
MFWRIVENCPVAVFATDVVGRHVFVNRPWSELTGLPRDEALGQGLDRIVHPEDVATVSHHWRQLITRGGGFSLQIRLAGSGAGRTATLQTVETSAGDGLRRFIGTLTPGGSPPSPRGPGAELLDAELLGRGMLDDDPLDQDSLGLDPLDFDPLGEASRDLWTGGPGGLLPDGPDRHGIFDGLGGRDPFDEAARAFGGFEDGAFGPGDPGVPRSGSRPPDQPDLDSAAAGRQWTVPQPRRPVPGEPTPGRPGVWEGSEDRGPNYPRGALPPGAEWRAAVVLHRDEEADLNPARAVGPPRPHADGDCGCMFAEMRRIEDACRDRERWLTTLLAELTTAVLIADRDGAVVAVNQLYCDLFDLAESPVDLVGTDCRRHLRPRAGLVDDPSGFAARLDTLLRRRRTLRREAVMFADGRVFERSHVTLTAADGYRGHLWLYSDVTDRRILEAEIEGLISGL